MREEYFAEEVNEDSIVSEEAQYDEDEWENQPTTPRWRDFNIGENQLD